MRFSLTSTPDTHNTSFQRGAEIQFLLFKYRVLISLPIFPGSCCMRLLESARNVIGGRIFQHPVTQAAVKKWRFEKNNVQPDIY
jgi:hypothetical protein